MYRQVMGPIAASALCVVPIQVAGQDLAGSHRWASVKSVALAPVAVWELEIPPTLESGWEGPAEAPSLIRVAALATAGALLGTAAGVGFGSLMVGDDKGFACGNCAPMFLLGLVGNLAGVSAGARLGAGRGPTPGGVALGLVAGFGAVMVMHEGSPAVFGGLALSVQGVLTASSALRRPR